MKQLKNFKFTIVVTIFILIGILMPGNSVPEVGIPGLDKLVHFGMFFTLALVYSMEYKYYNNKWPFYWHSLLGCAAFAIFTEVIQLFAIMRSFDLQDLLADGIGILAANGIVWIINRKFRRK